ncbi:hypothetical protein, partial [Armatimonas sp.]|uniref:hypothetical protein n=1 Tax=Armatimonas sp. TaxID=1872638 RepID=UPI003751A9ED
MYSGKRRFFLFLLLLLLFSTGATRQQNNPDFVWLEAEQATANIALEAKGWGHKEFLSGEKWVQVSIEADKVEKAVPEGGAVLRYDITIPKGATYEIWNRIGYEFARSDFDWRLDGG